MIVGRRHGLQNCVQRNHRAAVSPARRRWRCFGRVTVWCRSF